MVRTGAGRIVSMGGFIVRIGAGFTVCIGAGFIVCIGAGFIVCIGAGFIVCTGIGLFGGLAAVFGAFSEFFGAGV